LAGTQSSLCRVEAKLIQWLVGFLFWRNGEFGLG
jgi:hypothetical protein